MRRRGGEEEEEREREIAIERERAAASAALLPSCCCSSASCCVLSLVSAYDANRLRKTTNKKTVHDGTHRCVAGFYVGSWPPPSSNNFSN